MITFVAKTNNYLTNDVSGHKKAKGTKKYLIKHAIEFKITKSV